jgi:glycosyltransferase involved in cell wall biosynthesis/GT2 family glycosyltransferase
MKKLTVVIPCYNEAEGIAAVIKGFPRRRLAARGYRLDILVVDNNSTDDTAAVAAATGARVLREPAQGKGNALRTAFYNIADDTEYVVMLDGDGTYRSDEVLRLVELLESDFADVAVGSRLGGHIQDNAMRRGTRLGNWLFSFMTRYVYRVNVTDVLSGYFAWKREAIVDLRQYLQSDDFAIAMEMIIKMARMGYRIYSTPVTYAPSISVPRQRGALDGLRIVRSFVRHLMWRRPLQRVAFVSDTVWPYFTGGKEKRLDEITRRLVKSGRQVDIYTLKWWDGPRSIVSPGGVHLHGIARKRPIYTNGRRNMIPAITFSLACAKLLFRRFDIVDADSMPFFPLYPVRIAAWLHGKKMYATWHEVWGTQYWKQYMGGAAGYLAAAIETMAMKLPDIIISNSQHTTNRLTVAGNKRPVVTVPLGVDVEVILTAPQHELQSDIIFAGRLLEHKNVDMLVQAVAYVKRTHHDVRCLIVGNGPERANLEQMVIDLKLEDNVTFFNFLEDHSELYSLMKSSKMLVQPSVREGFGLVVVEANACGIPVITTRHEHNAAGDLIIEGQNGLLTDLDSRALSRQIRKILRMHTMQPRKTLDEQFGSYRWSMTAEQVEKLLVKQS